MGAAKRPQPAFLCLLARDTNLEVTTCNFCNENLRFNQKNKKELLKIVVVRCRIVGRVFWCFFILVLAPLYPRFGSRGHI